MIRSAECDCHNGESRKRELVYLKQLYPTQMAYWAKNHVAILTRATHLMTY